MEKSSSLVKGILVTPEKKRRRDTDVGSDSECSCKRDAKEEATTVKRPKIPSQSRKATDSDDKGSGDLEPVLSMTQSKYLGRVKKDREDGKSTAPWSMLKVLYDLRDDDDSSGGLTKEELMKRAEPYYGNQLEKSHSSLNGSLFGAWSSMPTTLEKKHGLVRRKKQGKGCFLFQLTDCGWLFCEKLFKNNGNKSMAQSKTSSAPDQQTRVKTERSKAKQQKQQSISIFFSPKSNVPIKKEPDDSN